MDKDLIRKVAKDEFAWCEHCDEREMIGKFIAYSGHGTQYCANCTFANCEITEEELEKDEAEDRVMFAAWLRQQLKELGVT